MGNLALLFFSIKYDLTDCSEHVSEVGTIKVESLADSFASLSTSACRIHCSNCKPDFQMIVFYFKTHYSGLVRNSLKAGRHFMYMKYILHSAQYKTIT